MGAHMDISSNHVLHGRERPQSELAARAFSEHSACTACHLRSAGFCRGLDDPALEIVAKRSVLVSLPANHEVFDGSCGVGFGILVRGYLRRVHYTADGRRQIVSLTVPGETFSLQETDGRGVLETATKAQICRIQSSSYTKALRDSDQFRHLIFRQAQAKLDRLRDLTWALGALGPEERLAGFLVRSIGFMPWQPLPTGGGVLTIELARTDIADLLGTTLESISRISQRFHREGLIRIHDPRHFEIPDPARLAMRGAVTEVRHPSGTPASARSFVTHAVRDGASVRARPARALPHDDLSSSAA